MVVKCNTWPHELQYTTAGKPVAYQHLTVSSFVQRYRYLIIMKLEDRAPRKKMTQHLEELMGDIDLYGWSMSVLCGSTNLSRAGTPGMILMTS